MATAPKTTTVTRSGNPGSVDDLKRQHQSGTTQTNTTDDEPDVFWGEERVKTSGSREPYRGPATYEGTRDTTKGLDESYMDFYGLSDAELRRVQESAFQAGVYGDERDDVPWGDYDADTFAFWQAHVKRSAAFYYKGKRVTPWDSMDSSAKAGRNRPGKEGPTKEPLVIRNLVAREDVDALGDRIGEEEIGMGISDSEAANYMSAYQAMQVAEQTAAYEAGGSGLPGGPGGRAPALPDLSAWLLDRIRKDHPEEFQKTNFRNAVNVVLDLIASGPAGMG